ncbi:aminoglycoside N-acetyltransferase AAC(6')-Il [Citrobacter werkmanii]|uniref:aminoglycoside N-acetyltransferase AAC(6')-Il n=1 Tax=Citrobacter werkmanii TaxID=67827 RepID=UPI001576911C|nr:aminoglycoside N-acetyltransferase AAC(6')-Il [Citrobacter werkmanii]NTY84907.1 aminoglycoside N-acetyltransferase AAC(6')-Il [Citrobacter werkmanii]
MDTSPLIRRVEAGDASSWLSMRHALWPDGSLQEHESEITDFFSGKVSRPAEVLIAIAANGEALGFAELSIRPYAEECYSGNVAFLEGWYVVPSARRKGIGSSLVAAAEQWARGKGCTEFASDTQLTNSGSVSAHLAVGFAEVAQVRCFRKAL